MELLFWVVVKHYFITPSVTPIRATTPTGSMNDLVMTRDTA